MVRGFGGDASGERPHVVLEFLEGPRLSTLLRRNGTLAVEQLLPLALQICSALHFLHGEEVVHLDVKPKNIIMGAPARLIDLSIARTFDEAVGAGPVGTDGYMAPECGVPGHGEIGPAADVWGVGVTLYEGLAGRLPFPPGSEVGEAHERYPQLVLEPEPLPEELPTTLVEPVMACLDPKPVLRPTSSELAGALEALVDRLPSRPVIGKLRPRWRPLTRSSRQPHPRFLPSIRQSRKEEEMSGPQIAVAVLALLVGATAGYLTLGGGDGDQASAVDLVDPDQGSADRRHDPGPPVPSGYRLQAHRPAEGPRSVS